MADGGVGGRLVGIKGVVRKNDGRDNEGVCWGISRQQITLSQCAEYGVSFGIDPSPQADSQWTGPDSVESGLVVQSSSQSDGNASVALGQYSINNYANSN